MKICDHRESNATENFYPRKQNWIDFITNIDQSAAAQEKKLHSLLLANYTYSIFITA